jgi:capsular polysaccharide biosynthesis protein
MRESHIQSEDQLTLLDIFDILLKNAHDIGALVLIFLSVGAAYFFFTPNKYEATATIQMALVAGQPVEQPQILIEKIKLPLYFSHASWHACDTDEEVTPSRKIAEKIKPILNKNAPFLSFSTTGISVKEATECLNAIISDIRMKQSEQAAPLIALKKSNLAALEVQLAQAEEFGKSLTPANLNLNIKDEKFSAATLLFATTITNTSQTNDLKRQINDLKIALTPPQTETTHLASPIYCPDIPTNKNLLYTFIISLFAGLVIGVIYVGCKKIYVDLKRRTTFPNQLN